ncbi:UNVERIFIED_ORG: hypothetical protein BDU10_7485 [Burkholderia sp. CF145]
MKRYRVTEQRKWIDDKRVEHIHEAVFIVKPFEGKRPKGRVYEDCDMWTFDSLISETGKPPTRWAWHVETSCFMVGIGKVPAEWKLIEE